MMLRILLYLILVVIGFGFAAIGPWWLPLLPIFVICAWWSGSQRLSAPSGFLIGGLAFLTLWLGAAWWIDAGDATGLAGKIGQMFSAGMPALDGVSGRTLVFAVTGVVSFLLGGIAGVAGVKIGR